MKIIKYKMENNENEPAKELMLLAWIRTAIVMMLFGFVIARLSFFMRQLSVQIGNTVATSDLIFSPSLGIVVILLATILAILAFFRYLDIQTEPRKPKDHLPLLMSVIVTFIIVAVGTILVYDLVHL
jgi:putative membrane protein